MSSFHKVLFIDDDTGITEIVEKFFSDAGYKIQIANTAKGGLELARKNVPDVILMDIVMPEMDGIEACQMLKKDPETQNIPVLLLTSDDNKYETEQVFQTGCALVVKKPFSCERLMDMVRTVIGTCKQ